MKKGTKKSLLVGSSESKSEGVKKDVEKKEGEGVKDVEKKEEGVMSAVQSPPSHLSEEQMNALESKIILF